MQSHEWQPTHQCLHTWLSTYVGPGVPKAGPNIGCLDSGQQPLRRPCGCTYGAHSTTRRGNGVHPTSSVRVAEGLAGPCQSSRGPHQGPHGSRRNDGVGTARTRAVPASGTAGRPQGSPKLRPAPSRGPDLAVPGAKPTTHGAHSDTQPTRLAFPMCNTIPAIAIW